MLSCPNGHAYQPRLKKNGYFTRPPVYRDGCFACDVIYELAILSRGSGVAQANARHASSEARTALYVANLPVTLRR